MQLNKTLSEILIDFVRRETRYLRHYWGEVIDVQDSEERGRVKVLIPELGRNENVEGLWAWPRYKRGFSVPPVGSHVEVYFMNADIERPVYLGEAPEFEDTQLSGFSGPQTSVLFEHENGMQVLYNSDDDVITIKGFGELQVSDYSAVKIGAASESYVLGDSLKTYLDSLKTYIDAHVHSGVTTGGGTSGPPSASPTVGTVLSSKIKGE